MKKIRRSIALSRETIRTLAGHDLGGARGGQRITSDLIECGTLSCEAGCASWTCAAVMQ